MALKTFLWFAGMWFASSIVHSIFGLQISITKRCALKILTLLSDSQNMYSEACKKYWKGIIRKNRIILLIIAALVICFVPTDGVGGYFAGWLWKCIFSRGASGLTENNILDSAATFRRFAKPGCEEAFEEDLTKAVFALSKDPFLTKF